MHKAKYIVFSLSYVAYKTSETGSLRCKDVNQQYMHAADSAPALTVDRYFQYTVSRPKTHANIEEQLEE